MMICKWVVRPDTSDPHPGAGHDHAHLVQGRALVSAFVAELDVTEDETAVAHRSDVRRLAHVLAVLAPDDGRRRIAIGQADHLHRISGQNFDRVGHSDEERSSTTARLAGLGRTTGSGRTRSGSGGWSDCQKSFRFQRGHLIGNCAPVSSLVAQLDALDADASQSDGRPGVRHQRSSVFSPNESWRWITVGRASHLDRCLLEGRLVTWPVTKHRSTLTNRKK